MLVAVFAMLFVFVVAMWIFNHKVRWYHKALYWVPIIKFIGINQYKRGYYMGAREGLVKGAEIGNSGKKHLKQRKLSRALEQTGAVVR